MKPAFLKTAASRVTGNALAEARLRLALRCVSAAAESEPSLFQTDDFRQALTSIGKMLGQKAETPGRKGKWIRAAPAAE